MKTAAIRGIFPVESEEEIINHVRFKGTVNQFFEIAADPDGVNRFMYGTGPDYCAVCRKLKNHCDCGGA